MISHQPLENIPLSFSVAMQLYITGSTAAQGLDESWKESGSDAIVTPGSENSTSQLYSTILQSPFVEVHQGRPDLKRLISKEIDEATGRMSVSGMYLLTS